jgi:hypothetical protein
MLYESGSGSTAKMITRLGRIRCTFDETPAPFTPDRTYTILWATPRYPNLPFSVLGEKVLVPGIGTGQSYPHKCIGGAHDYYKGDNGYHVTVDTPDGEVPLYAGHIVGPLPCL